MWCQVHTRDFLDHLARSRGVYSGGMNRWLPLKRSFDEHAMADGFSLAGSMVAELSQSDQRVRSGPLFPSPTKGARMISVSKGKFFTHREIDFILGWPVVGSGKYSKAPGNPVWD